MLEQAIPVVGSQPAVIYTGEGKKLFNNTALNIPTPVEGRVVGVSDDYVRIKSKDSEVHNIPKPKDYNTNDHTTNTFAPCVKVGDKVKAGNNVYSCNSFKNGDFAVGVQLLTAFTSWYGWEHEDAVVLSESAAKKFGHVSVTKIPIEIKARDKLLIGPDKFKLHERSKLRPEVYDDISLVKLGSEVKYGDPIFVCECILDSKRSAKAKLASGLDSSNVVKDLWAFTVPYGVEGIVDDIEFYPARDSWEKYATREDYQSLVFHFKDFYTKKRDKNAEQLGIPNTSLPVGFGNRLRDYRDDETIGILEVTIKSINPV